MKTRKLTIIFALSLLAILCGVVIIASIGQTPVGASIKFDPNFFDWDGGAPQVWFAYIRAAEDYDWHPREIVPESIRFEGIPPLDGELVPGAYKAEFDGQAVYYALLGKITHMQPSPPSTKTPIRFDFTVTGNLEDGTPFTGTGWIKVRFPTGPPGPPPPP
jgi:hypothetical protein